MKKQTYISRINNTLNYIEKNIKETLTVEMLAEVSGFSKFHFHRIFKAIVGETVNNFIRRVRVEKVASKLIIDPDSTITKIAYIYNYSSSQSLARDFKEFFRVSPLEFRKNINSKICHTASNNRNDSQYCFCYDWNKSRHFVKLSSKQNIEVLNKINMKVEIKNLEPLTVAYIRNFGPYVGDSELFDKLFGELCGWAGPKNLFKPDTQLLSVYWEDHKISDPEKLRLDVCVSIPSDFEVDGNISKQILPGGRFAVARFELKDSKEYESAWDAVYRDWLPESGYEPDDRPSYEFYRNDPDKDPEGKHIVDICVPIK